MGKYHYYDKVIKFKATYYDGVIEGRDGLPFFIATDGSGLQYPVDLTISVYENRGRVVRLFEIPYANKFVFYEPSNCWFSNYGDPPPEVELIESRKQAEKLFGSLIVPNMTKLVRWYIMFIIYSVIAVLLLLFPLPMKFRVCNIIVWVLLLGKLYNMSQDSNIVHIKDLSGKRYRFEV